MNVNNHRWLIIAVLTVGIVLRVCLLNTAYKYFADDAYIFMRYAQNAANGYGLVYNPGDRVMGFTSPLFAILISLLTTAIHFVPLRFLLFTLNLVLFLGLALVAFRIRDRFQGSFTLPLLILFYFPYLDASLNGMETTLFACGLFLTIALLAYGKTEAGLIASTLVALTRPEGVLFFVLVVAALVCQRPKPFPLRGAALSAALLLAWGLFAYAYYGSVLPQSMLAKSAQVTQGTNDVGLAPSALFIQLMVGISRPQYMVLPDAILRVLAVVGLLGAALLLFSLVTYARDRDIWILFPAFFLAVWGFYCVGKPVNIWSWYTIPTSMAFFAGTLPLVFKAARLKERPALRIGWESAVAVVCCLTIVVGVPRRITGNEGLTGRLSHIAEYLMQRFPAARSIMVADIGIIGYKTGWRVVDMAGLVSPRIFQQDAQGRKISFAEIVEAEKPDILLLWQDPRAQEAVTESGVRTVTFRASADRNRFERDYVPVRYAQDPDCLLFVRLPVYAPDRPEAARLSSKLHRPKGD